MKDFLRRWLNVTPEVVVKEVFTDKIVEVEMLPAKFEEVLDGFSEKLSNRATVIQLCSRDADDYERGRIQGQIEMLSKIMVEFAGGTNGEEG